MIQKDKTKIIIVVSLFIISAVLVSLLLFSGDDTSDSGVVIGNKTKITKEKLAEDIDSIIYTFGINKEWIRERLSKEKDAKKNSQPLWISKEIFIPKDLPVIELNYEITNYLRSNNFDDKVSENPSTKDVTMIIYDANDTLRRPVGNINLIYSDTVIRNAAAVCLVLDSLDSYNLSDVEKILSSTQEYSVILPLRNDKADYQSKIIDAKRDYLLSFSIGGEKDIEADFREDMKESLWRSKVKAAGIIFPKAGGIILGSAGNTNEFEREIIDEFSRNNLVVYKNTMFIDLRKSDDKVESLLKDLSSKAGEGRKFLFYKINLTPVEFSELDSKVHRLKKAGYKFYTFKEMLKKINKTTEDKNAEKPSEKSDTPKN